jgi:tyrosyl-tRNA synthetase
MILKELEELGLIKDISHRSEINSLPEGTSFYIGFDPTAPYLQIGNLVPLTMTIRLAQLGLNPVILFGGSTGMIGDPSGRSSERPLLEKDVLTRNIASQKTKVIEILERVGVKITFVDNLDWTKDVLLLDFLRDIGKHLTINYMISKEVINSRLGDEGISYTEFSYMLLQAYDFLHLFKEQDCKLQIGGSDQWGNLTAGLELIRKKTGDQAYCLSMPLLLNSEGKKFGKSEGGAIWIDTAGTSPYKLYQFLLNSSDEQALVLIKALTLITSAEFIALKEVSAKEPENRVAQHALAERVLKLVHGEDSYLKAKNCAEALFNGKINELSCNEITEILSSAPQTSISRTEYETTDILDLLVKATLCESRGAARRLISQGGLTVNGAKVNELESGLQSFPPINNEILILRSGKKNYALVKLT